MLTQIENIVILLVTMTGSMAFMSLLNRTWPRDKRRIHNDLIGWQLNILGTTYAVILGFMLYTVWTNFGEANLNVDLEANALRNVYRLAEGLPPSSARRSKNKRWSTPTLSSIKIGPRWIEVSYRRRAT